MNKKLFVLAGLALLLTGCVTGKPSNAVTSSSSEQPSSVISNSSLTSSAPSSSNSTTTSTPSSSSVTVTPTNSSKSSSKQEEGVKVTIPLYNPGFSNQFVNGDLSTLINHFNKIAGEGFLLNSSTSVACQIMHVTGESTFDCMVIGSGSAGGTLDLKFSKTILKLEMKVQAYNKPYTNQGVYNSNIDTGSNIYINTDDNHLDLSSTDTTSVPEDKNVSYDINSTAIKLYNKNAKNRVFIKEMTLTYAK